MADLITLSFFHAVPATLSAGTAYVEQRQQKQAAEEAKSKAKREDGVLGMAFEAAKKSKTYGFATSASKARTIHLIAGLAFCAACFPMHIYWRYGCEKCFRQYGPEDHDFKTSGLPEKVLLKQPIDVDKETPRFEPWPVEVITGEMKPWRQMIDDTLNRDGCGRPKDQCIAPIRHWKYPEAFWMHPDLYNSGSRRVLLNLRFQCDPSRLLFGRVNWNRADVSPGEAMLLTEPHVRALAKWLEGLRDIKFKARHDDELECSRLVLPVSVRQRMIEITGNEYGILGKICCVVTEIPSQSTSPSKAHLAREIKTLIF
ncbi:uncharacterized protein PAC_14942 [Phialocephala subalpina]|uniref:Uncharacterized protein n=1 Tax=Phialocephala subalpina TaxID=576137 RepID=A0A1L7XJ22_9HELO|nr:uncharacterized protein PAC_14942 [Phialocephala subalpina]